MFLLGNKFVVSAGKRIKKIETITGEDNVNSN